MASNDHWETHCGRCGDAYPPTRDSRICESCEIQLQWAKLVDGVRCARCDGHGRVYGTYCDLERAMNGRAERCPECHGSGRVGWRPDPDEVHPSLRGEVTRRVG